MKGTNLAKRLASAVMVMAFLCISMAALAESFEDRAVTFVNTVNTMMMEAYGEDVMCRYDSYEAGDYECWFSTVDAETADDSASLQLIGDDDYMTAGWIICKGEKGLHTAMATTFSFFEIQGLEEEEYEIAQWLDEQYAEVEGILANNESGYMDGYVTSNDRADFIVQSGGNGMIVFMFNYYPEGRSSFFDDLESE